MRPKFLHVCIPQRASGRKRGGGERESKSERVRERKREHTKRGNRGTEGKKEKGAPRAGVREVGGSFT